MSILSEFTVIATRPEAAMLGIVVGLAFIALGVALGHQGDAP